MTKPTRTSILIPFAGFYNSIFSEQIDDDISNYCEYRASEYSESDESAWPPELRLTEDELFEAIFSEVDYSATYLEVAREYCEAFNSVASERIGFELGLTFEEMQSPREYNFSTDRIFATIPLASVRRLFAESRDDGHEFLKRQIEQDCTSRDGFASFYSADLAQWVAKPLRTWDHNELGILLNARLAMVDPYDRDPLDLAVFYETSFEDTWQSHTDWEAFDRECATMRAERLREVRERDPSALPGFDPNDLDAAPLRCDRTADLFESHA
jgi:hypothetical protein